MRVLLPSLLFSAVLASPTLNRAAKPIYWLLAGDSTTASNTGWGDSFLSSTLAGGASGDNYGHGGASTATFRSAGDWAKVIKAIGTYKADYAVHVTIQFGHNDQKEGSGVTLTQYEANLLKFAQEVDSAGGTPVLVTPLTRRKFDADGKVVKSLAEERTITKNVGHDNHFKWIDLNLASEKYVSAIGETEAHKYNKDATDNVHLNKRGAVVFARIVSDLLVEKYPANFQAFAKPDADLSALIAAGKPA